MQFSRKLLLAFLLAGLALAQQSMTVAKLMDFVKSAIELKNPDKDVSANVARFRLTERFTMANLQELQNAGAGPATLSALAKLVTQSASLAPPVTKAAAAAKPVGPPDPPDSEKRQVLEATRDWALNYVKSLPDFLCLQKTDRSIDRHFEPGAEGSYSYSDTIQEKLTFFDHKENYELYMHNDTATVTKNTDSLGGSRSTGEWASLLGELFQPASRTDFHWAAWKTVRGKLAYEFQYAIEKQYSKETIAHGDAEKIVAGFRGSVFIEKGTNVVLRVTVIPDIPPDFPVQDVDQIVDYDYQNIGTQRYLLPLKSEVRMRDGHIGSKNEIQWRSYRKYSADTTLTFDDVDAAPGKN